MQQLVIETSTERGVIGCLENEKIIFFDELPFGLNQSKFLIPTIAKYQVDPTKLSCIGVGIGPGSYTGIRIGVSVAQAFAYAWKIPLVGVCSLDSFVPENDGSFVVILDARIAGTYVRKGVKKDQKIIYLTEPQVCSLEELGAYLRDINTLITPHAKIIKNKVDNIYPGNNWSWEERAPCLFQLGLRVAEAFEEGKWKEKGHLELMYLRETEAEKNLKK